MTDVNDQADAEGFDAEGRLAELIPESAAASFDDERRRRKELLAGSLRVLGNLRLAEGVP